MTGDGRADDGRSGTTMAAFLASASEARLVPVRVNPADSASLGRAIAFVAHTPARVALIPAWSVRRDAWEPLRQAAARFRDVLIIVPAGTDAAPAQAVVLGLDNVLAVEPGADGARAAELGAGQRLPEPPRLAVAAAGKAAVRLIAREPSLDCVALKRRLVETGGDPMWRPRK